MTEYQLRNALKEAKQKGQIGLFIWANWSVWNEMSDKMTPGNADYDNIFKEVSHGRETSISTNWNGLRMPGFITVPVRKLNTSNEYFRSVLCFCKKFHYTGPISFIPLNKLSNFY